MPDRVKDFFKSQFFIITVLLVLKAYFVRATLFTDHNLLRAFILELSVFAFVSGLVELFFKRGKKIAYFILNLIFSLLFLAIVVYFDQFSRIPIYTALEQVTEAEQVQSSIFSLLQPSDLILFVDLIVFAVLFLIRKYPLRESASLRKRHLVWVVAVSLLVSGFNTYTKKNEDLIDTTKLADNVGIFNAEAYETYSQLTTPKIDLKVTQAAIDQAKGIKEPTHPKYFGVAKGKNLIVIQMESIQNFVIGLKVNGQEVTPNLNKLIQQEALYFPHYNSQIGQGNTSDAEFITNTSLYPLENGAISALYNSKKYPSIPRLLDQNGYDTFTMHVNVDTFYNRNKLYPALGYDTHYDKSYFGSNDIIGMGASDNVLFSKSIPLLLQRKNSGQKFYANYVTLSSHNPFKIPADDQSLTLPPEYNGTMLADYLQAVHYTDQQLGNYFAELKQNGLWDNSVIALYGDHFAFASDSAKPQDKQLISSLLGREYDYTDMMNVPLIIKVPGMKAQTINQVGGQVDFLPTVMNLLGIKLGNQIHFGEDLLNQTTNLLGERYYLPTGSFINNDVLWVSEGDDAINRQTHQTASGTHQYGTENKNVLKLEEMSDSYIDQLPFVAIH